MTDFIERSGERFKVREIEPQRHVEYFQPTNTADAPLYVDQATSPTDPLYVQTAGDGYTSAANTTPTAGTALAANATWSGGSDSPLNYGGVRVIVYSDQASATNGLKVYCSNDGVNFLLDDQYTIPAGSVKTFAATVAPYIKVTYTNGATPCTVRICTLFLKNMSVVSSHRVQDTLHDDDDGQLTVSVLKLKTAQNNYVSGASTNSGNFKVSLEEVNGIVVPVRQVDDSGNSIIVTGANTGVKGIRVYGGPTDPISDIPVMITYEHHQVHEGEAHEYNYLISSLASGVSQDFRLNVPAGLTPTTRTPHLVIEIISTAEAELYLYEDMTFTAGNGGTLQTSYNRNRNSTTAAAMTVYLSPTPATTGTLIWIGLVGSGVRAGGGERAATEWDLKPNANYLFRITSRAAANKILARLEWYEDLGV